MMKDLLKPFLIALTTIVLFLVASRVTLGDECGGLYGGTCPRGEVVIDKMVWNPSATKGGNGAYVDNLGTSDHRFKVNDEVIYRLTVKNVSNVHLDKVEVVDWLPGELEFVSGPEGTSYDSNTREFRFEVKDLSAGESRDFQVKAKVVRLDVALKCVVNTVEARIPEDTDRDTAQVCLEGPVAEATPETGPAEWMLALGGSGLFGSLGLSFIKRARKITG